MARIWVYSARLKKRVLFYIKADIYPKKFKQFVREILELDRTFSIPLAARLTGVSYKTARKYLTIMEEHGLLGSIFQESSGKLCYVKSGSVLEELETLVRAQPGYLTQIYNRFFEIVATCLSQIMPILDSSEGFQIAVKADSS
ncbi:MAG: hypothetical protein ACTSUF_07495 [Candidatus Heimdallarchaeaceae archaeon]